MAIINSNYSEFASNYGKTSFTDYSKDDAYVGRMGGDSANYKGAVVITKLAIPDEIRNSPIYRIKSINIELHTSGRYDSSCPTASGNTTLHFRLCNSDSNKSSYVTSKAAGIYGDGPTDDTAISDTILTISDNTHNVSLDNLSIPLNNNIECLYLYIWGQNANKSNGSRCKVEYSNSYVVTFTYESIGLVYISNGSTFDAYQPYISDGTQFVPYIPYVSNGTTWEQIS